MHEKPDNSSTEPLIGIIGKPLKRCFYNRCGVLHLSLVDQTGKRKTLLTRKNNKLTYSLTYLFKTKLSDNLIV